MPVYYLIISVALYGATYYLHEVTEAQRGHGYPWYMVKLGLEARQSEPRVRVCQHSELAALGQV